MRKLTVLLTLLLFLSACAPKENLADAYGNFESEETQVSVQSAGELISFQVDEGQVLETGDLVGIIDTIQLDLKRQQLLAQRAAVASRTTNVVSQMDVLKTELEVVEKERLRLIKLIAAEAATPKQLDDIEGRILVLNQQLKAIESQNAPVINEIKAIDVQIAQVADLILRCKIHNPVKGTVLLKLSMEGEMVAPGKVLYRISDLREVYLRAYVSGAQLAEIALGQGVEVLVDGLEGKLRSYEGTISWISAEAEFTPKIVQTREERVNLVYAIKVRVRNDGTLKIGMPGELRFSKSKVSNEENVTVSPEKTAKP